MLKRCSSCESDKPTSEFSVRRASRDGLSYRCKPCVNATCAKWRQEHPGAHAIWYQENRQHKADYFKKFRAARKESEAARMALWAKLNPGKVNANVAKRIAAKRRAVPAWANLEAIESIYNEASRLRKVTGERYEVDHIVPLQGKTVCGLHWEGNLQILQKAANISKLNRTWPDMP